MLEALETMVFELRQTLSFCSDCFANVATLLEFVEKSLDADKPVPPEYNFILTIAALRAKLPVYELDRWIKEWDRILSEDYIRVTEEFPHGNFSRQYAVFDRWIKKSSSLYLRYSNILAGFSEEVRNFPNLQPKHKKHLKYLRKLANGYCEKSKYEKQHFG